ncbi:MAG: HAD hydrolase-like protein [Lachnospiraceae bacterium]|nr:HAD hydrolase-like protein [Lachnospiraceae bacterium]
MKEYLLFDLDGTLTDPKLGITTCVQYALKAFGIEEPDLDKLEPFIGPPLKDSFMEFYGFDEEKAEAAVEKYRERFKTTGLYENEIYVGIPEMLLTLQQNGMHLAVASSKPTVFVEKILEHFKIKQYFEVIVGSELDGTRVNKDEVVQEALNRLFKNKPVEKDKVYMIGDRKFDVEGARAQGIESVGVSYGYGSLEELKEAHADYIVRSVAELEKFLFREFVDIKPKGFFQIMWPFLYPFLLFILIKQVAGNALLMLMEMLGNSIKGPLAELLFVYNGATGELEAMTGNAASIMNGLTFVIAAAFIWNQAKLRIEQAKEEMYLAHLRPEPTKHYVLLSIATITGVLGLNILLELTGVTDKAGAYQLLLQETHAASLGIGLLCAGLITPIAEELLFRGIIFNVMKRRMKLQLAMIVSALCYGFYHMNYVQGVYAFIIGCLVAYAYEYFGTFFMPVIIHIVSSVLTYLITYTWIVESPIYSWPISLLLLIVAIVSMGMLSKSKKII